VTERLQTASRTLKGLLDIVASLTMIAASTMLVMHLWRSPPARAVGATGSAFRAGQPFPAIEGLPIADAAHPTLVMFLRSTCHFCSASMGFYAKLGTSKRQGRLVVVGSESPSTLSDYVHSNGFSPDAIVGNVPPALFASATPTLVLVKEGQLVANSWTGQLQTSQREAEVLRSIQ